MINFYVFVFLNWLGALTEQALTKKKQHEVIRTT